MEHLKIKNININCNIIKDKTLKTITKYVVFCLVIFGTNQLYSQCICSTTYNNSDQGNLPALTQASHFTNAENVTIAQGENIAFESGGFSLLCPGFVAEYGSVFSSKIATCNAGEDCFHTCTNSENKIESIDRGPFLQQLLTDPVTNEAKVIIKWRDEDNRAYIVDLISETGASYFYDEPYDIVIDSTYRILSLTGLDANTRYRYNINYGNSSRKPITGYFTTPPIVGSDIPDDDPVSFWVMGDAGSTHATNIEEMRNSYFNYTENDGSENLDTLKDCYNHFLNTDFIINLGDNAYQDGTDTELQEAVFEPYQKILKYLPLWGALGNHESDYPFIIDNTMSDYPFNTDTITGDDIHKYVFELPKVDTLGLDNIDVNEQYYSFDYGNIHFACLYSQFQSANDSLYFDEDGDQRRHKRYDDNNKMYEEMFEWLEADLMQAQDYSKWTVLFFHKPVLTGGGRDKRSTMVKIERDSEIMRNGIDSITNKYDIDLVLYGHSHHYERSYLVRCGNGDWEWNGTITEASDNLGLNKLNDHYGDFEILDYGCVDNNSCNQHNSVYDDILEKEAGSDNGTVFVLCGASSKADTYLCTDGYDTSHDFINHPAMRAFYPPDTQESCKEGIDNEVTYGGRGIYEVGSLNFEVKNNELRGTYISKDNSVLDQFTIVKNFSNYRLKQAEKNGGIKPVLSVMPNPFQSSFSIGYEVNQNEAISIDLFSLDGRLVKSITKEDHHLAGQYNRTIDATDLDPGVYLIRLISPNNQITKKVMKAAW